MNPFKMNCRGVLGKAVARMAMACFCGVAPAAAEEYPHPVTHPDSPVMLVGDWFDHPHGIDFTKLPDVPREHIVIHDVTHLNGVNQHNYLIHHDGRFWAMWSDGPQIEDRVGQVVKYATSEDGVNWSEAGFITGYPPNSGPDSPHYNTRHSGGFRYIARGFWVREDGELLALLTLDEAAGFFGAGLELWAYRWNPELNQWEPHTVVHRNAINNFPPKRLPTGEWMMSRRPYNYTSAGVDFMIGGVEALDSWELHPVPAGPLAAEEPHWWELPDENLMALFRDNNQSGYLFRSFSTDHGRTWSEPVRTDFPDARSKFHGLRMSDGRYAFVSNGNHNARDLLTLAISEDGMVFDRFFHLVTGERNGVDYPMMMEHFGYLYIAHSGGFGGRKQSVELQRVRIADLDEIEMVDARLHPPQPPQPSYEPKETDVIVHTGNTDRVHVNGPWGHSTQSDHRIGDTYRFMQPGDSGSITFTPDLPETGRYEVFVWFNTAGNRSPSVPHLVHHAKGRTRILVDQREGGNAPRVAEACPEVPPVPVEGSGGLTGWVSLGTYDIDSGGASVEVRVGGLADYVVADAVLFSPRMINTAATNPPPSGPVSLGGVLTFNPTFLFLGTGGVYSVESSDTARVKASIDPEGMLRLETLQTGPADITVTAVDPETGSTRSLAFTMDVVDDRPGLLSAEFTGLETGNLCHTQVVNIRNDSGKDAEGIRIRFSDLAEGITPVNQTGVTGDGHPMLEVAGGFAADQTLSLHLVYRNPTGSPLDPPPALEFDYILKDSPPPLPGHGAFASRINALQDGTDRISIEFESRPGTVYAVEYTDDVSEGSWIEFPAQLWAGSHKTRWFDPGTPTLPPVTGLRAYRVKQVRGNPESAQAPETNP